LGKKTLYTETCKHELQLVQLYLHVMWKYKINLNFSTVIFSLYGANWIRISEKHSENGMQSIFLGTTTYHRQNIQNVLQVVIFSIVNPPPYLH
jgi:hypothetical protein